MIAGKGRLQPAIGVAAFAVSALLCFVRYAPPSPKELDAPDEAFSVGRAMDASSRLLEHAAQGAAAAEEQAAMREAISGDIKRLGLIPHTRTSFTCSPSGTCATMTNVMTAIPGREVCPAVLITASFSTGGTVEPLYNRSAAGVGVLIETARALLSSPPLRSPVLFLFSDRTDGRGSLGALAFMDQEDWMRQAGVVINVEARGISVPRVMLETSGDQQWLASKLPAASGLFTSSVTRRLLALVPFDSSFDVFRSRGFPAVNVAGLGARGEPEQRRGGIAERQWLQQQGENVLELARNLGDAELPAGSPSSASYFDVLGLFVIRWRENYSLALSLMSISLLILAILMHRRELEASLLILGRAVAGLLGSLVFSGLLAFGVPVLQRVVSASYTEGSPRESLLQAVTWAASIAAFSFGSLFLKHASWFTLWASAWLLFAAIGLVAVVFLDGGTAYPFVVPALVAACTFFASRRLPRVGPWVALPPSIIAVLLIMPVRRALSDAIGLDALPLTAVLGTMILAGFHPLMVQRRDWLGLLTVPSLLSMILLASFSATAPAGTDLRAKQVGLQVATDADARESRLLLDGESASLPVPAAQAGRLSAEPLRAFPWLPRTSHQARTALHEESPPTLDVLSLKRLSTGVRVRTLLRPPREGADGQLHFPLSLSIWDVRINGRPLPREFWLDAGRPRDEWAALRYLSLPIEGVEIEWTMPEAATADVYVALQSRLTGSLPDVLAIDPPLLAARTAQISTVVYRRVKIEGHLPSRSGD